MRQVSVNSYGGGKLSSADVVCGGGGWSSSGAFWGESAVEVRIMTWILGLGFVTDGGSVGLLR